MIHKYISISEALDQQIHERAKRMKLSENQVIILLLEEGLRATESMSKEIRFPSR